MFSIHLLLHELTIQFMVTLKDFPLPINTFNAYSADRERAETAQESGENKGNQKIQALMANN
jgi:hypothetical protein